MEKKKKISMKIDTFVQGILESGEQDMHARTQQTNSEKYQSTMHLKKSIEA